MTKKILIAVPCMDFVASGFAASLAMLRKPKDMGCAVSFICGSLIYDARNKLAQQAIKEEFDYIFWLDSDMIFMTDTLNRLMETMNKTDADIVSGIYFRRSAPYTPVAFSELDIDLENGKNYHADYTGELSGVHEVAAIGFGCVLMKTEVLFDVFGKFGSPFEPIGGYGEDLSFCWRARELDYKVFIDFDVKCGHVGHITVNQTFYEAWKEGHQNAESKD